MPAKPVGVSATLNGLLRVGSPIYDVAQPDVLLLVVCPARRVAICTHTDTVQEYDPSSTQLALHHPLGQVHACWHLQRVLDADQLTPTVHAAGLLLYAVQGLLSYDEQCELAEMVHHA